MYHETEIPDIEVPDDYPEPSIPSLFETEVGQAAQRQVSAAILCVNNFPNEAITSITDMLQDFFDNSGFGSVKRFFVSCQRLNWLH
jgi:hypothetical protein